MRIWLLTVGEPIPGFDGENPRLLRTGLLARALTDRGHSVTWWTSAFDHFGKRHRTDRDVVTSWEGGDIHLLRSVGYPQNLSARRFIEHRQVARKFSARATTLPRPDLIVASLPTIELAHAAEGFGRSIGAPVVIDVRDLWPDALVSLLPAWLRTLGRVATVGLRRRAQEALAGARAILAVSPTYLDWGLRLARRGPRPSDHVFPIGFTAPAISDEDVSSAGSRLRAMGVDDRLTLCWYVGSFGRTYDLEPVIEAARILEDAGRRDIQFVFSGEGERGDRWRAMATGRRNVVFTGWIEAPEAEWLRHRAAVGLQPYAANAPQGLANKLFEYLSGGMPVISSLKGESADLLREFGCGVTYAAGDAQDFIRALRAVIDAPRVQREMGERARMLFRDRFDGTAIVQRMSAHLEAVACGEVRLPN